MPEDNFWGQVVFPDPIARFLFCQKTDTKPIFVLERTFFTEVSYFKLINVVLDYAINLSGFDNTCKKKCNDL